MAAIYPSQWGPARAQFQRLRRTLDGECVVASPPRFPSSVAVLRLEPRIVYPVKVPVTSKHRGKIRTTDKTFRPAEITETTFKLLLPKLTLNSGAEHRPSGWCSTNRHVRQVPARQTSSTNMPTSSRRPSLTRWNLSMRITIDTSEELLDQTTALPRRQPHGRRGRTDP